MRQKLGGSQIEEQFRSTKGGASPELALIATIFGDPGEMVFAGKLMLPNPCLALSHDDS